ncbi:protein kintoun-like [Macrosteles quadrilineatus]|uniref:protein kintoun-like n=1 Tax=Macrosteles quadrilineatus TaxID=74068 RepID=UPI0023E1AFD3|nr:protein kintoun-like [Macrosteles quadrilineatus]
MEDLHKKKWEDLNLSRDELKNIGEALQKEEFRNLLIEYAKEINDPDNRKQYEQEITQLENERGVDVKFIHPSSGYVVKTSVNGETKAFINICSNDNVGEPSSTPGFDEGHRGLKWSIPYCMAPPREDLDKKNNSCLVYDVVFHSNTLHLAKNNEAFKNLVNNTALDAVEDSFHVSLDKVNLKFPKMAFKGTKHATVIRKKIANFQPSDCSEILNYPYPPPKEGEFSKMMPSKNTKIEEKKTKDVSRTILPDYTIPKYSIKHRNRIDMQHYTNDPLTKMSMTIPDELIVEIDLPLLKNCSDSSIDVTEKTLILQSESPAKYKLQLNLPYEVDSNKGNAKFDTVKRVLIVTLPVIKTKAKLNSLLEREDSGVESDINNGRNSGVSSSDDDALDNDHSTISGKQLTESPNETITHENNKSPQRFLKPNIHYIIPNFECHLVKDTLSFNIQIPNVNPESIAYCFLSKYPGFHLTFISIGNSFFPVNYAMYVRLPTPIESESFHVEVWDNNVIAQVKITASFDVQTFKYYVGTDEKDAKTHSLHDDLKQHLAAVSEEKISTPDIPVVQETEKRNLPDIQEEQNGYRIESLQSKSGNKEKKLIKEIRDLSISESGASSFDESSSSPTHQKPTKSRTVSESHNGERRKCRGILKIGRSLSESSADDYAFWNDENGEKPKKTVRFSDAIQTQTFRMNSSILGQRKKNQRKTRNKKRAMERRLSESGGESEGESDMSVINNIWLKEPESSDVSEVSDISESAESDDGQKEDPKQFLPCSSKRNHKRRGKKSARKSAATAKFHYSEN